MKIVNVTHGELEPEEKTAINILAKIECPDLSCEFCPVHQKVEGVCVPRLMRQIQETIKEG